MAVRDAIIQKFGGTKAFVPKSELGFHQHQDRQVENQANQGAGPTTAITDAAHQELMNMKAQRDAKGPDYSRNMPKYCTFTATGEDTRGAENPYRTDAPPPEYLKGDGKGIQQSIKDRFFGVDDNHAQSILNKHEGKVKQQLTPPEDQEIKTLWIGGVEDTIQEEHLKNVLGTYGDIVRVHIVKNSKCAFVEFATRAQAEQAAAASEGSFDINGISCRVSWAKKKSPSSDDPSSNYPSVVQPPVAGASPEAYANYQQYVWQAWQQYYAQQAAMAAAQQQTTTGGASTPSTASASASSYVGSSSQGVANHSATMPIPPIPPPPGASANAQESSGRGGPAKKSGGTKERQQATAPYYPSMDPTRVGSRVVEGS